ncbi:MAG: hypothetical protein M3Y76_09230, partial [Chloroflexota bacterium]|nr:hypothetical protein [Chloroflexota bacterium]
MGEDACVARVLFITATLPPYNASVPSHPPRLVRSITPCIVGLTLAVNLWWRGLWPGFHPVCTSNNPCGQPMVGGLWPGFY